MILDTGTLIGIIIALTGSLGVMGAFWKQNTELHKEVIRLRLELRKALRV